MVLEKPQESLLKVRMQRNKRHKEALKGTMFKLFEEYRLNVLKKGGVDKFERACKQRSLYTKRNYCSLVRSCLNNVPDDIFELEEGGEREREGEKEGAVYSFKNCYLIEADVDVLGFGLHVDKLLEAADYLSIPLWVQKRVKKVCYCFF